MQKSLKFFIGGKWVDPVYPERFDVINPSTEEPFAQISMGSQADVDWAVAAAKLAFTSYSQTSPFERLNLIRSIVEHYEKRADDLAAALSHEMGAPLRFAREVQVQIGLAHLKKCVEVLGNFPFAKPQGNALIVKEPIGVVGLITPWNWPLNQIACKVGPALAAGCTMILKPSEIAPLNAMIFAEILNDAGVPPGVFNLVNGDGPTVGQALASHHDVDMISFTGSTRAGVLVAKAAADTVKRVHQELGGKSPDILLPDADFERAVVKGLAACFGNAGQSCNAPTRMFVPRAKHAEIVELAATVARSYVLGPPDGAEQVQIGPVISSVQYQKIQALISSGIEEGADLVAGGLGRGGQANVGYFVRPTIFANVKASMRIAREEIFGPVLSILPYEDVDEAVAAANDTVYGLAAYVQGRDLVQARNVAKRLRCGNVYINHPDWDPALPFGGYKQSGNGREYAEYGLEEFLEIKAIAGFGNQAAISAEV